MNVLARRVGYGHTDAVGSQPTLPIHCCTCLCSAKGDSGILTTGSPHRPLTVSDGRILLIKKLLLQMMSQSGNCVKDSQFKEVRLLSLIGSMN